MYYTNYSVFDVRIIFDINLKLTTVTGLIKPLENEITILASLLKQLMIFSRITEASYQKKKN